MKNKINSIIKTFLNKTFYEIEPFLKENEFYLIKEYEKQGVFIKEYESKGILNNFVLVGTDHDYSIFYTFAFESDDNIFIATKKRNHFLMYFHTLKTFYINGSIQKTYFLSYRSRFVDVFTYLHCKTKIVNEKTKKYTNRYKGIYQGILDEIRLIENPYIQFERYDARANNVLKKFFSLSKIYDIDKEMEEINQYLVSEFNKENKRLQKVKRYSMNFVANSKRMLGIE